MRRTGIAPLVLAALLLSAGAARAQQVPSPFRWLTNTQGVGVFAGYLFTTPTLTLNAEEEAEFGPQSAPVVGVLYGGRLTGPLDGQVSVAFAPSERRLFTTAFNADSTLANPTETGETVSMPLLMADVGVRLNLTGRRTYRGLQPYVAAMGGVVATRDQDFDEEAEIEADDRFEFGPSFALTLRAGTDWYPTERISVSVELSDRLWQLETPPGFQVRRNAIGSEWKNNYGITIGGAYHF
jgi:opacity protein-like surface antigen